MLNSKSRDPVRVTQFLDWIFVAQAHYDLLAYGIDGEHWIDTGNSTYAIPAGVVVSDNYNFPGYVLLWKPTFKRMLVDASDEQLSWMMFFARCPHFVPYYNKQTVRCGKRDMSRLFTSLNGSWKFSYHDSITDVVTTAADGFYTANYGARHWDCWR